MMKSITKIDALSVGKVLGTIYAGIGVVFGLIFSVMSIVAAIAAERGMLSVFFAIGSIVLLPLGYGILGFLGGAVCAWLYNISSRWTGGIKIQVAE